MSFKRPKYKLKSTVSRKFPLHQIELDLAGLYILVSWLPKKNNLAKLKYFSQKIAIIENRIKTWIFIRFPKFQTFKNVLILLSMVWHVFFFKNIMFIGQKLSHKVFGVKKRIICLGTNLENITKWFFFNFNKVSRGNSVGAIPWGNTVIFTELSRLPELPRYRDKCYINGILANKCYRKGLFRDFRRSSPFIYFYAKVTMIKLYWLRKLRSSYIYW